MMKSIILQETFLIGIISLAIYLDLIIKVGNYVKLNSLEIFYNVCDVENLRDVFQTCDNLTMEL